MKLPTRYNKWLPVVAILVWFILAGVSFIQQVGDRALFYFFMIFVCIFPAAVLKEILTFLLFKIDKDRLARVVGICALEVIIMLSSMGTLCWVKEHFDFELGSTLAHILVFSIFIPVDLLVHFHLLRNGLLLGNKFKNFPQPLAWLFFITLPYPVCFGIFVFIILPWLF